MSEDAHRIEELKSDVAASEAEAVRLRYEVLRLRSALERIFRTGRGTHVEIARDALNA